MVYNFRRGKEVYDENLLPSKLREGREFRNYSQQGMADSLGVHVTAYNKWEIGKNQPNAIVLAKIASELRLDLNFFFTKLSATEADLDHKDERNALIAVAEEVKNLRSYLVPSSPDDPTVLAVEHNLLLRRLVDKTRHLDDTKLQRIYDKIDGYLDGLEENIERDQNEAHGA